MLGSSDSALISIHYVNTTCLSLSAVGLTPNPINICTHPSQVYEDPLSCNHFFKCANGTLTHEQCENGLLFEPATSLAGAVHNHCSYNWAAQCLGEDKVCSTPKKGKS